MTDLKEDAYDSGDAANQPSEDDVGKDEEETVDEDLTDDDGEKGAVPGQKLQAKWDEMYKRLLKFKEKHGHCLVPNRYAEDAQLGSWGTYDGRTSECYMDVSITPISSRLTYTCYLSQSQLNADITRFLHREVESRPP